MELIDTLLREYNISHQRIPAERKEIDRIDLDGKIEILEGDIRSGMLLKIIGAIGYFMREEYYDAARSTERAVRAAAESKDEPYRRVLLTEFGILSYTRAQELGIVPLARQGHGIRESLAWAFSRHASALADLIEHKIIQRTTDNNISLCDAAARLRESVMNAIVLFQSVGIDPFSYCHTKGMYTRLARYVGQPFPKS